MSDKTCCPPAEAETGACCAPAETPAENACCSPADAAAGACCAPASEETSGSKSACCGGGPVRDANYVYGPQPFEIGEVATFAGPVPVVSTLLRREDHIGGWKVRLNIGRHDFRVRPGLYAVGSPDDTAPVLVTANYKLTFDHVRRELGSVDAWLLVLDSNGVNVWCAAGKGLFATDELVRRARDAQLEQVVSHRVLIVPQLGATGVAGHEVRKQTGFKVVFGPVRAADIPAFLAEDMTATPQMRQVEFPLSDRAKLIGVELSMLWRPRVLAWTLGALVVAFVAQALGVPRLGWLALTVAAAAAVAVIAGVAPALFAMGGGAITLPLWGLLLAGAALASFVAMNFTGSSTYTSPSGVEWEMRHWIPAQIAGGVLGMLVFAVATVLS
jgi:hypothetical protein